MENTQGAKSQKKLIISSIIVLLVLIGFVWYNAYTKKEFAEQQAQAEQFSQQTDAQTAALQDQKTSDSVSDIDADLSATNIDSLETK